MTNMEDVSDIVETIIETAKKPGFLESSQANTLRQLGWLALTMAEQGNSANRADTIIQSRLVLRKDPLGRNAFRIWEAFVMGPGLKWDFVVDAQRSRQAGLVRRIFNSPQNRTAFTFESQRKAYKAILTDGELYAIVFFGLKGTAPVIRYVTNSLEMMRPITHQDDNDTILYYPRRTYQESVRYEKTGPIYEKTEESILYIRSWDASDEMIATSRVNPPRNQIIPNAVCVRLAPYLVHHRGWPTAETIVDWVRAYKGFMEDRVTYNKAIAKFAWQLKGKSTEPQLKGMMEEIANPSALNERGVGIPAGRVFGSNNADLTPLRATSGGVDSHSDGRMIRQQVGAGMGITEPNLTGDPSVGNLASLTAMDGTMAKNFQADQQLLRDFYRDILSAALTMGDLSQLSLSKAIDWAQTGLYLYYLPVVDVDIPTMIGATVSAAPFLPEEYVQRKLLKLLGEENPDVVLSATTLPGDKQTGTSTDPVKDLPPSKDPNN